MSEYDRTMIFMPLAEAQRYFNKGEAVDVLEVFVADPDQVAEHVAAHARGRHPRRCTSRTGGSATRASSPCSRSSAT